MSQKTFKREPLESLEDIRDDCIAIVLNSRMSFKQVHEKGGPTPATISKWLYRETRFPQLATIRAMLKACDHDLTIAPKGSGRIQRINPNSEIKMPERMVGQSPGIKNSVRKTILPLSQRMAERKSSRRK